MSSRAAQLVVGIVLTVGLGGGAALLSVNSSASSAAETEEAFARACAGLPSDPHVERALYIARAHSLGGLDPVCDSSAAVPTDATALTLVGESGELMAADTLDPKRGHRRF